MQLVSHTRSAFARARLICVTASALTAFFASNAAAQVLEEYQKITATPSIYNHEFGRSVATSGNRLLVGAPQESVASSIKGAAYLFNLATGEQTQRLVPTDPFTSNFGLSLDICGTTAIVGAPSSSNQFVNEGKVFLFNAATSEQTGTLVSPDPGKHDRFGQSVAISGTLAVVGAPWRDGSFTDTGTAYVFDISTGKHIWTLQPTKEVEGALFGYAVAIHGERAIVGMPGANAIALFNVLTGERITEVNGQDAGMFGDARFGASVAIHEEYAAVGAPDHSVRPPFLTTRVEVGAVRILDATHGTPTFFLREPSSMLPHDFGYSVAIRGSSVLVGSIRSGSTYGTPGSGLAYLFDFMSLDPPRTLRASDSSFHEHLGYAVALGSDTAVASKVQDQGNYESGAVYLFDMIEPCSTSDIARPYEMLDLVDIVAFVDGFLNQNEIADLNGDTVFDMIDVSAFTDAFVNGCP